MGDDTKKEGTANWQSLLDVWGAVLAPVAEAGRGALDPKDRRFSGKEWEHPVFDIMRQSYAAMASQMMGVVDTVPGLDEKQQERARFAMKTLLDTMSPSNGLLTNPVALKKAIDTKGQSVAKGVEHLLTDLKRGQLTHTDPDAFKLGENIAATPGKIVYQTPLFQLIQYDPVTPKVMQTPLIIFPPWINRFYILDLTAEKSFIKWAVDQGVTVFVVSWKSADASMKDVIWDDYIRSQIEAIDTVRSGLGVADVHAIGYCVAGTTLAATLSILAARGEANKVKSATFFTAQVDFTKAGELLNFIDDDQFNMMDVVSSPGYIDGRYLAMTFNMLRGNDLIWSNVVKNYLMGEDYPAFDLLHWNGDVTNLPARWHRAYLADLYKGNKLVEPGAMRALDSAIDLTKVETPCYIQAGVEDHIAPAESVWKIMDHFKGPMRFLLAGSGHIAGVVNPPSMQKYQYWTNDAPVSSLADFRAGATETKGSWWPHWIIWLKDHNAKQVAAKGARVPGEGSLKALDNAPGSYVKTR